MILTLHYELFKLVFTLMLQQMPNATNVSKSWKRINEVNSMFFTFYTKPKTDAVILS